MFEPLPLSRIKFGEKELIPDPPILLENGRSERRALRLAALVLGLLLLLPWCFPFITLKPLPW